MARTPTQTPAARGRVLIVDDDDSVRVSLEAALDDDFDVVSVGSAAEARALDLGDIDVVLSDYAMPEMNGAALLRALQQRWPHLVAVLVTGLAEHADVRRADDDASIYRVITKPYEPDDLAESVRRAVSLSRMRRATLHLDSPRRR